MSSPPSINGESHPDKAILIIDDHPLFRRGLAALIAGEPGLTVCGEAPNFESALETLARSEPDLVIVDLEMEGRDGVALIKEMKSRHPDLAILVVTMHDELIYAERALRAGARGYLSKRELNESVLSAIHQVLGGELSLPAKMASQLAEKYVARGQTRPADSPVASLTDRELEVFRLLGHGRTTREIARLLGLSIKTIESHRENLKQKLSLHSAAALVRSATRWVETGKTS